MSKKSVAIGVLAMWMASTAFAVNGVPLAVAAPIEDGGLLAVAATCLAIGIRIVRRKQRR